MKNNKFYYVGSLQYKYTTEKRNTDGLSPPMEI